ncbi:hypothetical protein PR048_032553 [Dryococelus australis]|uniref:Uncharacterized protein n=1 Tax=Dryococelus australis TaxID=614101 RepID=A0ABQ9G2I8_9NEOP|nr:hypothetical protein PR048_032553 [Dryococelus australis]
MSMEQRRNEGVGRKREIREKTCRPAASSGTIPTCENPGHAGADWRTEFRHSDGIMLTRTAANRRAAETRSRSRLLMKSVHFERETTAIGTRSKVMTLTSKLAASGGRVAFCQDVLRASRRRGRPRLVLLFAADTTAPQSIDRAPRVYRGLSCQQGLAVKHSLALQLPAYYWLAVKPACLSNCRPITTAGEKNNSRGERSKPTSCSPIPITYNLPETLLKFYFQDIPPPHANQVWEITPGDSAPHSRLVRHRSGARDALGSNPGASEKVEDTVNILPLYCSLHRAEVDERTVRYYGPMRWSEVEQCRNVKGEGGTEEPRKNPPTSGIVPGGGGEGTVVGNLELACEAVHVHGIPSPFEDTRCRPAHRAARDDTANSVRNTTKKQACDLTMPMCLYSCDPPTDDSQRVHVTFAQKRNTTFISTSQRTLVGSATFQENRSVLSSAVYRNFISIPRDSHSVRIFKNTLLGIGEFCKFNDLYARLHNPLYSRTSDVCSLAVAPVLPHIRQYGIRLLFPWKSAIGAEPSRALLKIYFEDIPPPHANKDLPSLENYTKGTTQRTNSLHLAMPLETHTPSSFSRRADFTGEILQAGLSPRGTMHARRTKNHEQFECSSMTCFARDCILMYEHVDINCIRCLLSQWEGNDRASVLQEVSNTGRGGRGVSMFASHQGEPGSIPGRVTPGFSHVRIVPWTMLLVDKFSRGSPFFSCPCIPVLLHTHLASPSYVIREPCYCATLRLVHITITEHKAYSLLAVITKRVSVSGVASTNRKMVSGKCKTSTIDAIVFNDLRMTQWKATIGPAFSRRCQTPCGPMANVMLNTIRTKTPHPCEFCSEQQRNFPISFARATLEHSLQSVKEGFEHGIAMAIFIVA